MHAAGEPEARERAALVLSALAAFGELGDTFERFEPGMVRRVRVALGLDVSAGAVLDLVAVRGGPA